MAEISLDRVELKYGDSILLDGSTSLTITNDDKLGLIGRNGAGKSSLLKLLAGITVPDSGMIHRSNGLMVGYIPQEPIFNNFESSIIDEVMLSSGDTGVLLFEYNRTIEMLADASKAQTDSKLNQDQLLNKLQDVQHKLDTLNAWQFQSMVEKYIADIGLNATDKISQLSGGARKKVAITKALVMEPDLLLLDEPTNHLDIPTIKWLEQKLNEFKRAIVVITHDRRFLDNIVNKIVELDRGMLSIYPGTFYKYLELKEQNLEAEIRANAQFDKFLAQEEVWIRRGIEARRTRNEGRVKRLESLRSERATRQERVKPVSLAVDTGASSGKIVAKLDNVTINFGSKYVARNLTKTILRGDKLGIIGANGAGKSTLVKAILGQFSVNSGEISLGTNLQVAYYDQFREQLDEKATVQDMVSQGQDYVTINGRQIHIASYLEKFLFMPSRFRLPISMLSGGERNRLFLARLFSQPANVLVLDEPTNDLDMDTLEVLEDLLVSYSGTIILVSHDRDFLDNVVTDSLVLCGDGNIVEINGGYTEWIRYCESHPNLFEANIDAIVTKNRKSLADSINDSNHNKIKMPKAGNNPNNSPSDGNPKLAVKHKLSYKEKLELEDLPKQISQLEEEQMQTNQQLMDDNLYRTSPQQVVFLKEKLQQIDAELLLKFERWEYLENIGK